MKKILLAMVMATSSMAMVAQNAEWTKNISALDVAKSQAGTVTAMVPSDGSVYVTGTYDKDFTFGSTDVSNPDAMASAYIAKYNAAGEEQWIVTLYGASAVGALTTSEDGTLYAACTIQDEVEVTYADNATETLNSPSVTSTAVLKITAAGAKVASKTIKPANGVPSSREDWTDPCYITPRGMTLSGGKVYVAVNYTGNVAALNWKGSYTDSWGAYMDNTSAGIFSLDTDLATVASVATVQMTGIVGESDAKPRGINITSQDGVVYAGFFGSGKLTMTTPSDSKDFAFTVDDDDNTEYAFVVVAFEGATYKIYQYDAPAISNMFGTFNVAGMDVVNGNLYLAGTYKGFLPFDNTKQSSEEDEPNHFTADDLFAASINLSDMSTNWGWTSGRDWATTNTLGGATNVGFDNNGNTILAYHNGDSKYTAYITNEGALKYAKKEEAFDAIATGDTYSVYLYRNGEDLTVSYKDNVKTSIKDIEGASNQATEIYTINGVRVKEAAAPGLYIIKSADGVQKVLK